MSARVSWNGLAELRAELRRLPADLALEASAIVNGAAESTKDVIVAGYEAHARSSNLANHVTVTASPNAGAYGAGAVVKSAAKHAWMFENGTQARHTAIGANRGSMPAAHVAIPAIVRGRRAMYEQLKELLTRHGLAVSGDA